jgi:hypothetical protein
LDPARTNKDIDAPMISDLAESDTCDMVSNALISPRTEVFNTYGEHLTNAQLLACYGFALDGNDNDIVNFDLQDLPPLPDVTRSLAIDRDVIFHLYRQVLQIFPRYDRWKISNLVYHPDDLSSSTGSATTVSREDELGWHVTGGEQLQGRQLNINVNSDAKVSHALWVYCALLAVVGALAVHTNASTLGAHDVAAAVRQTAERQLSWELYLELAAAPAVPEADVYDDGGGGDLPRHEGTEKVDKVRVHPAHVFGFRRFLCSSLPWDDYEPSYLAPI